MNIESIRNSINYLENEICYTLVRCSSRQCTHSNKSECAVHVALECMKQQIPKKPLVLYDSHDGEIHDYYLCSETKFICGTCGEFICFDDPDPDRLTAHTHCCHGHAIDWSELSERPVLFE